MSVRGLLVCTAVVLLSACASAGPSKEQEEKVAELERHWNSSVADPALDPIRAKVPVMSHGKADIPFSMLANSERPNKQEKVAILTLVSKIEANRREQDASFGAPPSIVQTYRASVSAALAQLYSGVLTYGQFAREYQRAQQRRAEQTQEANAAHAAAQAQRRAAAARSIQQAGESMRQNGPRYCNSNAVGNSISTVCY